VVDKKKAAEPEPTEQVEPPKVDELPEVKAASEAIRRAEGELKKACAAYKSVRRDATDKVRKLRESTVGDILDGTLKTVSKHPLPGVAVAALVGFFLGRLFRR
jgi:ElaB/YqjD/DUF883 family membrane-anchored ribosome-binding protein